MGAMPQHLLGIGDLTTAQIEGLLRAAGKFLADGILPAHRKILANRMVVNLFFEPSTRTRVSFEIAAKRLGADVININAADSSLSKGETTLDMLQNLQALGAEAMVLRHPEAHLPQALAKDLSASIINAGDGNNEHPTQALLDALTMRQHKRRLEGLVVAICGDIAHSRVARSNVRLLGQFGVRVRLIAPPGMMADDLLQNGVQGFDDIQDGIHNADIVMMLRIQKERMQQSQIPDPGNYFKNFGLTHAKLKSAKSDVLVMHPGPMNRNVEISTELADDPQYSIILDQARLGVAMRMAVLQWVFLGKIG
jgi:aspartate carbamoyltransferase catalytic subunit